MVAAVFIAVVFPELASEFFFYVASLFYATRERPFEEHWQHEQY